MGSSRVVPQAKDEKAGNIRVQSHSPSLHQLPLHNSSGGDPRRRNASTGFEGRVNTVEMGSLLMSSAGQRGINVLRTTIYEIHEQIRYRWVIHPLSHFKTFWDFLSAVIVIYYCWKIPFMVCFEWYNMSHSTAVLLKVLDAWGIIDVILRFRTGIIDYGTVVMNPKLIRRAYMSSVWFPIDLLSSIPFEYIIPSSIDLSTRKTFKVIKYIKLPRLLRIGRFVKYLKKYRRYSGITIMLNTLLFAAHVAGCLWVAVLGPCNGNRANEEPMCESKNLLFIYLTSLHHGLVTLVGISVNHVDATQHFLDGGYGSVSISSGVYVWSIIVSTIGAVLTAALFGNVIDVVQSLNRAENSFRKKMDQINHEMDALCLPKHMRARVTAYYDYLWLNSRTLSEELNLLKDNGMSIVLREQIAVYLFKDYLQKIPFFQLATDSVLGMICMQLRQVIYMPDDYIIREGESGKELFMIVKGIVRVMPAKNSNESSNELPIFLGDGDFFGEIGVVMEVERTRSVKAECMAELCILSREGFEKILVEFPEFAIAMRRLIIKRVTDLCKTEDKQRIEKVTALADRHLRKKINNMRKFRGTANVVKNLQSPTRLSKVISGRGPLLPPQLTQVSLPEHSSESDGPPLGMIYDQETEYEEHDDVTVVDVRLQAIQKHLQGLEKKVDRRLGSLETKMIELMMNLNKPRGDQQEEELQEPSEYYDGDARVGEVQPVNYVSGIPESKEE